MVSKIWVPQSLAKVLLDLTRFWPMGNSIWGKWANNYASAQLQVQTSPWNFKWGTSIQRFLGYAIRNVWTQFVANLTSYVPMGKPIWGKWANVMTVHNKRPKQFHRTSNGENPPSGYRDMGSASLAAARPTARRDDDDNTLQPGGLRGNKTLPLLNRGKYKTNKTLA